jgi:hypothetical protein
MEPFFLEFEDVATTTIKKLNESTQLGHGKKFVAEKQ